MERASGLCVCMCDLKSASGETANGVSAAAQQVSAKYQEPKVDANTITSANPFPVPSRWFSIPVLHVVSN